jgi:hypothetical protein
VRFIPIINIYCNITMFRESSVQGGFLLHTTFDCNYNCVTVNLWSLCIHINIVRMRIIVLYYLHFTVLGLSVSHSQVLWESNSVLRAPLFCTTVVTPRFCLTVAGCHVFRDTTLNALTGLTNSLLGTVSRSQDLALYSFEPWTTRLKLTQTLDCFSRLYKCLFRSPITLFVLLCDPTYNF